MSKNVKSMVSDQQGTPSTPEQIEEYKKLKMRNEWIKMNQKRLDEIEYNRLRHVKHTQILVCINILMTGLLYYLILFL